MRVLRMVAVSVSEYAGSGILESSDICSALLLAKLLMMHCAPVSKGLVVGIATAVLLITTGVILAVTLTPRALRGGVDGVRGPNGGDGDDDGVRGPSGGTAVRTVQR